MAEDANPLEAARIKRIYAELAACGIEASRADVRYSDMIQDYEVVLGKLESIGSHVQFDRLARLGDIEKLHFVFVEDDARQKYHEVRKPLDEERDQKARDAARQKLSEMGQLDLLPRYDPDIQTLSEYAQSLELISGLERGSVLAARSADMLAIIGWPRSTSEAPKMPLLFDLLSASNLHEFGVRVVVIGEEVR